MTRKTILKTGSFCVLSKLLVKITIYQILANKKSHPPDHYDREGVKIKEVVPERYVICLQSLRLIQSSFVPAIRPYCTPQTVFLPPISTVLPFGTVPLRLTIGVSLRV